MDIFVKYAYLIAAVLFILGIKSMGRVKTAKRGNLIGAAGMAIAIGATIIASDSFSNIWYIIGGITIGAILGTLFALKIKTTSIPEYVAICNGLGGGATAIVAGCYLAENSMSGFDGLGASAGVLVGSISFSGSGIAFGKLAGFIKDKAVFSSIWSKLLTALLFASGVFLLIKLTFLSDQVMNQESIIITLVLAGIALILGLFLVMPIGGADMPVVISLLNAYSGISGAFTGFAMQNVAVIVTGTLIGASGMILTGIMCKAMDRSLLNVLFGGLGVDGGVQDSGKSRDYESVKSTSAEEVAMILDGISSAIIVPGYGMAVGHAQHAVAELAEELIERGVDVKFAIHPVAGRMPGHMNVLLAEASVSYDLLKDADEINSAFKNTDFVYVIGANDVVNPAAVEDKTSPIYGMPILNAHEARTTVVVKRSLSPGFANIKNPLFERDNSLMLFADAKKATEEIVQELKELK